MRRRSHTSMPCPLSGNSCQVLTRKKCMIQIELFHQQATMFNSSVWTKENILSLCKHVPLSNAQALKTCYQVYLKDKSIVNGSNTCDPDNDIDGSDEEIECELIDIDDDGSDDEEVDAVIVDAVEVIDSPIIVSSGKFESSVSCGYCQSMPTIHYCTKEDEFIY